MKDLELDLPTIRSDLSFTNLMEGGLAIDAKEGTKAHTRPFDLEKE